MKQAYIIVAVLVAMGLSFPGQAQTKIAELKAACKENPTHAICQEREAKAAKTKAKREAKMDAQIDRVKGNR